MSKMSLLPEPSGRSKPIFQILKEREMQEQDDAGAVIVILEDLQHTLVVEPVNVDPVRHLASSVGLVVSHFAEKLGIEVISERDHTFPDDPNREFSLEGDLKQVQLLSKKIETDRGWTCTLETD